jgi:hypothetical protein
MRLRAAAEYMLITIARPWTTFDPGLIPSDGVLRVLVTVPGNWVPGDKHYFQALVRGFRAFC